MALKLGELHAILKTDNRLFKQGLAEGKRDFDRTGNDMDRSAASTAASVALSWATQMGNVGGSWRSTAARARDTLRTLGADFDRFAGTAGTAGGNMALNLLGKFGGKLGDLPGIVGKLFSLLPPQVAGVVGIAGAAIGGVLAAAIGAAVTSGLLLALGGGVLAGGIALVANRPEVKKAADSLKNRFLDIDTSDMESRYKAAQERMTAAVTPQAKARARKELDEAKKALDEAQAYNKKNFSLKDAAKPFAEPVRRALETFREAGDRIIPKLADMFKEMAPTIDKLAPALVSMAEKALPGMQKALEASKPLFDTLANKAPEIGEAVSRFFEKLAAAGPGANLFLKDLIGVLIFMIDATGTSIAAFALLYQGVHTAWSKIKSAFVDGVAFVLKVIGQIIGGAAAAFGWIPGLGPKLKTAAAKFADFAARANTSLNSIRDKEVTITVKRHEAMFGKKGTTIGGIGGSGFKGLASGGPFRAGDVTWVGENGPELVAWGDSGMVIPNHVATRAPDAATGGRQEVTVKGEILVRGDGILTGLRDRIAIGGGNVQAVLGSNR